MNNLKFFRLKKGITQREVAKEVGISEQCYQRYEYGIREPIASIALRIAMVLDTTVDQLWGGSLTAE